MQTRYECVPLNFRMSLVHTWPSFHHHVGANFFSLYMQFSIFFNFSTSNVVLGHMLKLFGDKSKVKTLNVKDVLAVIWLNIRFILWPHVRIG